VRIIYAVILVAFLATVGLFCLQNMDTVGVKFLGWSLNAPLPVLVLLVYLLGMVSGWGVLSFVRHSIRGATETK